MATFNYDVVIAGASFGGCAAALAAAADPKVKVVLLEPSDWVGGQATSQGLTRWDETAAELTEATGSPSSYRYLRNRIRSHYDGQRSALGQRQAQYFNPGFAGVGPPFGSKGHPFGADPQVARAVLTNWMNERGVTVKFNAPVTAVNVANGAVTGLVVGNDTYEGKVYLDATELGDLLPRCAGLTWVIGAESKADTGEDDAEQNAHPEWIQPFTLPIALEWGFEDNDANVIEKPANYDDIRTRQGFDRIKPPGPGEGDIRLVYNVNSDGDTLWNYRQFIDGRNFDDNRRSRTTINVGGNDYLTRALPANPQSPNAAADAQVVEEARAVSIAYLYFMQNDVPRDDGNGRGYKNVMVDVNAFGTADGTAPAPYIREARRLANPRVRVVQRDIDRNEYTAGFPLDAHGNLPELALGSIGPRAQNFRDSCGIGQYGVDVHEGWYDPHGNQANAAKPNIGTQYKNFPTVPFQVPLGALLPKELNNLVAACKNIGTTHLTSGAYRVHPVEWAIGEAAGVLAAYCSDQNVAPGQVWGDAGRVMAYQRRLLAHGAPIFWWDDVRFEDGADAFAAIQLLGAHGVFEGDGRTRNFDPGVDFSQATSREVIDQRLNHQFAWPAGATTRAQAAVLICSELEAAGIPLPLDARSEP
jgi:hypothetical protein